jgi:hypothetical protein
MTHYFSKLARMTGLPSSGTAFQTPRIGKSESFLFDKESRATESLSEEVLSIESRPAERAPVQESSASPAQAIHLADQRPVQTNTQSSQTAARSSTVKTEAMTMDSPNQESSAFSRTMEFTADSAHEHGVDGQNLQPERPRLQTEAQQMARPMTDMKSAVDTRQSTKELQQFREEQETDLIPSTPLPKVIPDLDFAVELDHKAQEPVAVNAELSVPMLESKQNKSDAYAELWREVNAWLSAQPETVAMVKTQAEPGHVEVAQHLAPVQDFSLSIGNINIIVEEPQKATVVTQPAVATGPSATASPDGFFRLDRHYL